MPPWSTPSTSSHGLHAAGSRIAAARTSSGGSAPSTAILAPHGSNTAGSQCQTHHYQLSGANAPATAPSFAQAQQRPSSRPSTASASRTPSTANDSSQAAKNFASREDARSSCNETSCSARGFANHGAEVTAEQRSSEGSGCSAMLTACGNSKGDASISARGDAILPSSSHAGASLSGASSSSGGRGDDVIVIHVCDDNRRINRDFYCSRELLLTHMTYFTPYLADERRFEEIDISVHCDVHIFEWLMEYIHQPGKPPLLDPGSVISVLISADFLQMKPLTQHCIQFLRNALPEVLRLPIDLSCVSDALLGQLAALLEPEDVEKLRDKKDKISSRLYSKKLEALLAQEANTLHRCAFCARLFTAKQREWEPCPRAPTLLNFHGNPIAEHVANRAWDVQRWVASLKRGKGGAREAFWRLWGLTNFVTCSTCDQAFPICELDRCLYHPQAPTFDRGENRGHYPCCGQQALRFDPGDSFKRRGCTCRRHTPVIKPPLGCTSSSMEASARKAMKIVETALAHHDLVLVGSDPTEGTSAGGHTGVSFAQPSADKHKLQSVDDDDNDLQDELLYPVSTGNGNAGQSGGAGRTSKSRPASAVKRLSAAAKRAAAMGKSDRDDTAARTWRQATNDTHDSDDVVPTRALAGSDSDASFSDSDASSAASLSDSDSDILEPHARHGGVGASSGHPSNTHARASSAARSRSAAAVPRRGWQLESMMMEDEQAMSAMSSALEKLRREPPPPNQPPALMVGKPMFLDRRLIMHVSRGGGGGVVWPRTAAAAVKRGV